MASRRNSTIISCIRSHVLSYQQLLKLNATLISRSVISCRKKSRTCSMFDNFFRGKNMFFQLRVAQPFFPRIRRRPHRTYLGLGHFPSLKLGLQKSAEILKRKGSFSRCHLFWGARMCWVLGSLMVFGLHVDSPADD